GAALALALALDACELQGQRSARDRNRMFGPRPQIEFLPSAVAERFDTASTAPHEQTQPQRPAELVGRERGEIERIPRHLDPADGLGGIAVQRDPRATLAAREELREFAQRRTDSDFVVPSHHA